MMVHRSLYGFPLVNEASCFVARARQESLALSFVWICQLSRLVSSTNKEQAADS